MISISQQDGYERLASAEMDQAANKSNPLEMPFGLRSVEPTKGVFTTIEVAFASCGAATLIPHRDFRYPLTADRRGKRQSSRESTWQRSGGT